MVSSSALSLCSALVGSESYHEGSNSLLQHACGSSSLSRERAAGVCETLAFCPLFGGDGAGERIIRPSLLPRTSGGENPNHSFSKIKNHYDDEHFGEMTHFPQQRQPLSPPLTPSQSSTSLLFVHVLSFDSIRCPFSCKPPCVTDTHLEGSPWTCSSEDGKRGRQCEEEDSDLETGC
eukprot:2485123-Rhodomonas_salina.2